MFLKSVVLTTSIAVASSLASTTISSADILSLSTAVPSVRPTMNSALETSTPLHTGAPTVEGVGHSSSKIGTTCSGSHAGGSCKLTTSKGVSSGGCRGSKKTATSTKKAGPKNSGTKEPACGKKTTKKPGKTATSKKKNPSTKKITTRKITQSSTHVDDRSKLKNLLNIKYITSTLLILETHTLPSPQSQSTTPSPPTTKAGNPNHVNESTIPEPLRTRVSANGDVKSNPTTTTTSMMTTTMETTSSSKATEVKISHKLWEPSTSGGLRIPIPRFLVYLFSVWSVVMGLVHGTGTPSASGNMGLPTGIRNGASGIGISRVFRHVGPLGKAVRGVALPLEAQECCSGLCCKAGEICTRASGGPRCWPGTGANVAREESREEQVHAYAQGEIDKMPVVGKSASTSSETCRTTGCPKGEICVSSSEGLLCWPEVFYDSDVKGNAALPQSTHALDNGVHRTEQTDSIVDKHIETTTREATLVNADTEGEYTGIYGDGDHVMGKAGRDTGKIYHGAGDRLTVLALHVIAATGFASLVQRWL